MATNQSPQLLIRSCIGNKVNYLQATIAQEYGRITSSVNHDTLIDPYSLISLSNCSLPMIITSVRMALHTALIYCSTRSAFNNEIHHIESMSQRHNTLSINSIVAQMEYKVRYLYYHTRQYADANEYACDRYFARSILKREKAVQIEQQSSIEQDKFYLTCSLKDQQLIQFKQDFERLLQYCYAKDMNLKKFNINIISRPNYPAITR